MPRFDGTGPEGKGPRTGRGMGNCGGGRGRGCRFNCPFYDENSENLETQHQKLQNEITELKKDIADLKKDLKDNG
jgi:hypothetical protein